LVVGTVVLDGEAQAVVEGTWSDVAGDGATVVVE